MHTNSDIQFFKPGACQVSQNQFCADIGMFAFVYMCVHVCIYVTVCLPPRLVA